MKKVLFTATVNSHILHFHLPYLKMFKEKGYEVHVATGDVGDIPYCDKKHLVSFDRNPFSIKNVKAIFQLREIMKFEDFDLVHTHTPSASVVTRLAAKNFRKYGMKVFYTAHGFHFYKGAPLKNWLLFYPIERFMARYTDVLITINLEDFNFAKRKFRTNVEYIPGVGVDTNRFMDIREDEKKKLREELNIDENEFVIIYPAELRKGKNQVVAISALRKLIFENFINVKLLLPRK